MDGWIMVRLLKVLSLWSDDDHPAFFQGDWNRGVSLWGAANGVG